MINIPLRLENFFVDENNDIQVNVDMRELPKLVDEGYIKLSKKNKLYSTFNEAIGDETDSGDDEYKSDKNELTWIDSSGKEYKFEYAIGNSKIGTNTIIINMSTASNCMSLALGLCSLGSSGKCYALHPEKLYKAPMEYRKRQEHQWSCMTPQAIAEILKKIKSKFPSIKYVRLNEAGEFRNIPSEEPGRSIALKALAKMNISQDEVIDDVNKLKNVAKLVPEFIFYTYTHRIDLFTPNQKSNLGNNVVITGSGFMIDNAFRAVEYYDFVDIMKKIETTKSRTIELFDGESITNVVDCLGSCAKCNRCKINKGLNIIIPIHGPGAKSETLQRKLAKEILSNPEINKILKSGDDINEKIKKILSMINVVDTDNDLSYLYRILGDKKDFIAKVINNKDLKTDFVRALVATVNPIDADVFSDESNVELLKLSIDALHGDLEQVLSRAVERGKPTPVLYAQKMIDRYNDLLKSVKTDKDISVPLQLAKKYKISTNKLKRMLNKEKQK